MITQKYIDRFHSRYKVNTASGCWEWTEKIHPTGYGWFWVKSRYFLAHRFSAIIHGLDMSGQVMRHKCDNRACVNPAHLETGSHSDNAKDTFNRKRHCHGNSHGRAKLTESDVLAMRAEYAADSSRGAMKRLSEKYGIKMAQTSAIINRQYWKHI